MPNTDTLTFLHFWQNLNMYNALLNNETDENGFDVIAGNTDTRNTPDPIYCALWVRPIEGK